MKYLIETFKLTKAQCHTRNLFRSTKGMISSEITIKDVYLVEREELNIRDLLFE